MALTAADEGLVEVDHGLFHVITGTHDGPLVDPGTDDPFVNAETYSMFCVSRIGSHRALVRLEAWDAPPDSDAEGEAGWELTRTIRLLKAYGPARAFSPLGPGECEIPLPVEPEQALFARILCKGRQRALEFVEVPPFVPPDGTEQWLIQFWPAETNGSQQEPRSQ